MTLSSDKEVNFLDSINNSFKEDMISDQIMNLNNIGHDLVSLYGINTLRSEFIAKMLDYMHNNYLRVPNYDFIILNQLEALNSFYLNYRFYIIDFPERIIHQLIIMAGCRSLSECDTDLIKDVLRNILINRIENMNRVIPKSTDIIMFTYYLDMVDGDISNFHENYLKRLELLM